MLTRAPSLLITDDDWGFRETLRGLFEPSGLRTLTAADGEEALDIVRREEVHVLMLDMHMPKLTGLETLARVKQIKAMLPCILLSAAADEALAEQARERHVYTVLSKAVGHNRIRQAVLQALERTYNWAPTP